VFVICHKLGLFCQWRHRANIHDSFICHLTIHMHTNCYESALSNTGTYLIQITEISYRSTIWTCSRVVHLQHGSMRRRSFSFAVDGADYCQRPPAWPRRQKNVCSPSLGCCPSAWRIGPMNLYTSPCTLNTDGPLETPADSPGTTCSCSVWRRGGTVENVLINQSADKRAQG